MENLNHTVSRREFFVTIISKHQRLLQILGRLIILVAIAWLATVAFRILQDITLHGWAFIGCIGILATLFWIIRYIATCWYSRLTIRGKTVYLAMGTASYNIICVAIGILAWQQFQSGNQLEAGFIALMLAWAIFTQAIKNYRRNTGLG